MVSLWANSWLPCFMPILLNINEGTHNISQVVRTARSWLKVCFLISLEVRVITEVRLDSNPNKPNKLKRIPSHQNSNCFQTWKVRKLNTNFYIINKVLLSLSHEITRTKVQRAFWFWLLNGKEINWNATQERKKKGRIIPWTED